MCDDMHDQDKAWYVHDAGVCSLHWGRISYRSEWEEIKAATFTDTPPFQLTQLHRPFPPKKKI